MFSVNQSLLYGKELPTEKHITQAKLYDKLSGRTESGRVPVGGKQHSLGLSCAKLRVTLIYQAVIRSLLTSID